MTDTAKQTPLNIAKLRELMKAATPGPWKSFPVRLFVNGVEGPIMSYLAGDKSTPVGMTVSLASERLADHHLMAGLRNSAEELIASAERVKVLEACLQSIIKIDMAPMRKDFGEDADNQFRLWAQNRARQALEESK